MTTNAALLDPVVTPVWAVLPFVIYLLSIAVIPLFLGHLWESNRNKLILALLAGLPVLVYLLGGRADGLDMLIQTGWDYVAFMALLGALFTISGGVVLSGTLAGTPVVNTAFLAVGAVL